MENTTNTKLLEQKHIIEDLITEIHTKIIGQKQLVIDLIIGLLTGGHILIEGVPGVAKTFTVSTLSKALSLDFQRIQFTPDLLPSDLIGTEIYNQALGKFETKKGPLFANFILADEINRAPSKVQSALLEAMAEKQISIGDSSYALPQPFLVIATQNPIEQTGTYSLPEAELDRFLVKSVVSYPSQEEEKTLLLSLQSIEQGKTKKICSQKEIKEIQSTIENIFAGENIIDYISSIIAHTRNKHPYLQYGASPRGSIALLKAAKVYAFLDGRDFVIPEDVKQAAVQTLAHRLVLNYDALAENITPESIIQKILNSTKVV